MPSNQVDQDWHPFLWKETNTFSKLKSTLNLPHSHSHASQNHEVVRTQEAGQEGELEANEVYCNNRRVVLVQSCCRRGNQASCTPFCGRLVRRTNQVVVAPPGNFVTSVFFISVAFSPQHNCFGGAPQLRVGHSDSHSHSCCWLVCWPTCVQSGRACSAVLYLFLPQELSNRVCTSECLQMGCQRTQCAVSSCFASMGRARDP